MSNQTEEQVLWAQRPSQLTNLGTYIFCGLTFWLVVPIFVALVAYLKTRCTRFVLTTHRLKTRRGVLSPVEDEIELYRVKDSRVIWPLPERFFSLGTVELATSDDSHPLLPMPGLRAADRVRAVIRDTVEQRRQERGVREVDVG